MSLTVKDIQLSREFYEKLGFSIFAGDQAKHWLVMKNGDHIIGLFQGMFDTNMLTFNPGWDQNADGVSEATDIRSIHQQLKEQGLEVPDLQAYAKQGPASFTVKDPDGNVILFDQHV
ncbi:VOC family protein [Marinomonas sp. MED121]|uniref:VOC family protein n=1 Tax=Marinomonas sp. MED121 TaxID=314277 RepID=UPI001F5F7E1B|nr:VOC family protein [Marinomonas sp. MED121]